jgi:hypothetical protein
MFLITASAVRDRCIAGSSVGTSASRATRIEPLTRSVRNRRRRLPHPATRADTAPGTTHVSAVARTPWLMNSRRVILLDRRPVIGSRCPSAGRAILCPGPPNSRTRSTPTINIDRGNLRIPRLLVPPRSPGQPPVPRLALAERTDGGRLAATTARRTGQGEWSPWRAPPHGPAVGFPRWSIHLSKARVSGASPAGSCRPPDEPRSKRPRE